MIFKMATVYAVSLVAALACARAQGDSPDGVDIAKTPYQAATESTRTAVFVSDLHFGVGKKPDGSWHPTEDFRWASALKGFLDRISADTNNAADLVIVGDFLEMWQPPRQMCAGANANTGCTIEEMSEISAHIVKAHSDHFVLLREFSERGENRLHIIPGNHDASIRYAKVWSPIGDILNAASGKINLVESGLWSSADGKIVAEHGHQIGHDVNKYPNWPRIIKKVGLANYIERPWGELFVQTLFNEQEETYSIIDNLSPETAGARYRAADRGLWKSAGDIARFLAFNLAETSVRQKIALLGPRNDSSQPWKIDRARNSGHLLFLRGLQAKDPLRIQIESGGEQAESIKQELAAIARNPMRLPDQEVMHLCDLIAEQDSNNNICWDPTLGAALQSASISQDKVIARHLETRLPNYAAMQVFVFGHTHQVIVPRAIQIGLRKVTIANTGAFQRLIDEAGFLRRLNGGTPQEALKSMTVDDLPPCYSAIVIRTANGDPKPELRTWHMQENGSGFFVSQNDSQCS